MNFTNYTTMNLSIFLFLIGVLGFILLINDNLSHSSNSNIGHNSIIIGLLNSFNKYIPSWLKTILKLILFSIIIFRIFGIHTIFDIFFNYTKLICIIICFFAIIYELFYIFMLFIFSSGKIEISDLLPIYIQNWLTMFKELSANRDILKNTLEYIYIHIGIYFIILILILIFF